MKINRLINKFKSLFRRFDPTIYQKMGKWKQIDQLVDDFYEIMKTDPHAKECFATHADLDLQDSAQKLKYFLSGWTGGPQLYMKNYGHPRLRMRHAPFKIGRLEGEQWLYCMEKALSKSRIDQNTQKELYQAFSHIVMMLSGFEVQQEKSSG